ncbi:TPR-like protein [Lipomyces japonicus]|uniref:TPR-like protein n=1 Tax=Lipomyces japonicus TaxID=56871 RepID=UPI0034CF322B
MDEPLPIIFDEVTKHIGLPNEVLTPERETEVEQLNALYKSLINLNADVPPPPNQISGRLSEQVKKLKEAGNTSFKKLQYADAIKMYTLAIEMALKRPPWEAAAYVREEVSVLYSNRAQAYMSQNRWGEALVDADTSIYLKRNVSKSYWRKGKCLIELGRLQEAKDILEIGIEFADGNDNELKTALSEVNGLLK